MQLKPIEVVAKYLTKLQKPVIVTSAEISFATGVTKNEASSALKRYPGSVKCGQTHRPKWKIV